MSDHLIDRPARLTKCHGCGRHILAAIDGGLTVAADPGNIPLNAEIAARLAGRSAYDVITIGMRVYLAYRDMFRISVQRGTVVADHGCGAIPRYQLIPPKKPAVKKARVKVKAPVLEEVPF